MNCFLLMPRNCEVILLPRVFDNHNINGCVVFTPPLFLSQRERGRDGNYFWEEPHWIDFKEKNILHCF
jgi:hypothetical protein